MRHCAITGDDGYSGIRDYLEVASVSLANASLVVELFAFTSYIHYEILSSSLKIWVEIGAVIVSLRDSPEAVQVELSLETRQLGV
jgi:hypothetical protein